MVPSLGFAALGVAIIAYPDPAFFSWSDGLISIIVLLALSIYLLFEARSSAGLTHTVRDLLLKSARGDAEHT
jgi:hypothetical protein